MTPYTQEFALQSGDKLTAVVLDQRDFDIFCDDMERSNVLNIGDSKESKEGLAYVRATKLLPMMVRGSKTEKFFERWNIKTDRLSVIVRGTGDQILNQMMSETARRN